jgi:dTDP-4-dehydrorhamnose reductase
VENHSTDKKTILITGAQGQLGQEFQEIAKEQMQYDFLFASKETLSISEEQSIDDFFSKHTIDACINCAAFTAVDRAEHENELATTVNAKAVGYLAKACKKYTIQFVHISTDYVFDGTNSSPYRATDKTNPVNFYGQTKLEGELLALKENEYSIIIRTAWVYSQFGNNFVKTMIRLMNERESIGVVNDQFGCPTYAGDLAAAIFQIVCSNNIVPGIYHYSNQGKISWYDFAKEIAQLIHSKCEVNPISTLQFPTPAARPKYSVLDTEKIQTTYGIVIPNWKDSLKKCIDKILS